MKILVREYNDNGICNYVWKKVRINNPFEYNHYNTEDGRQYCLTEIIKVSGDYRKLGYVQCTNCGEVIKKGKEEEHYAKRERSIDCAKCIHFKMYNSTTTDIKIKDGVAIKKMTGKPICTVDYWHSVHVDNVDKPAKCLHFACRRRGTAELPSDFLYEHKDPYKNILTENTAIAAGWKYVSRSNRGRQYTSDKTGKLLAYFDTNGILEYFRISHRGDTARFTYSDVYDEFIGNNGKFKWLYMADSTIEKYSKHIRKLYTI